MFQQFLPQWIAASFDLWKTWAKNASKTISAVVTGDSGFLVDFILIGLIRQLGRNLRPIRQLTSIGIFSGQERDRILHV